MEGRKRNRYTELQTTESLLLQGTGMMTMTGGLLQLILLRIVTEMWTTGIITSLDMSKIGDMVVRVVSLWTS